MTDFDSSLPIKTENAGDVGASIVDAATPSQSLAVDANGAIKAVAYGNNGTADVVLPIDPTSGGLKVDIIDPQPVQVDIDQFINGHLATPATDKANVIAGYDGANYRFLSVDASGNLNVNTGAVASGTTIHVFDTSADVAKNATFAITYTVTAGKTLKLKGYGASASGKIKAELKVGSNVEDVKFTSTSNPNADGIFQQPISVAAGTVVTLTITNRDSSQDVYGYINGEEV